MKHKRKYSSFYKKLWLTTAEAEQHNMLKDFMLSLSFEELIEWNNYLFEGVERQIQKNIKQGLTEEDKEFYRKQFARFDDLAEEIKLKKAA